MKIYTKSGDGGSTSLVSGRRVSKADALIDAYGTVDELNSFVGLLITEITDPKILEELSFVQNMLFNIGSLLAKDESDYPNYPTLENGDIQYLEKRIDHMDQSLEKMTAFILPAGSTSISYAHICRTISRRAERRVVELELTSDAHSLIIMFLNRLSDYFFVLARYCHFKEEIPEVQWDNNARSKI